MKLKKFAGVTFKKIDFLPGVNGPVPAVDAFAEKWTRLRINSANFAQTTAFWAKSRDKSQTLKWFVQDRRIPEIETSYSSGSELFTVRLFHMIRDRVMKIFTRALILEFLKNNFLFGKTVERLLVLSVLEEKQRRNGG